MGTSQECYQSLSAFSNNRDRQNNAVCMSTGVFLPSCRYYLANATTSHWKNNKKYHSQTERWAYSCTKRSMTNVPIAADSAVSMTTQASSSDGDGVWNEGQVVSTNPAVWCLTQTNQKWPTMIAKFAFRIAGNSPFGWVVLWCFGWQIRVIWNGRVTLYDAACSSKAR